MARRVQNLLSIFLLGVGLEIPFPGANTYVSMLRCGSKGLFFYCYFYCFFGSYLINSHAAEGTAYQGRAWRPNPVQVSAGIQFHLKAIAPLLTSSPKLNSQALISTLRERITAPEAAPNQIFSGVVLMETLSHPEHLAAIKEYIQSSGESDSGEHAIVGIEQWSLVLQKNPEARRALANAVASLQHIVSSSEGGGREGLQFNLNALFDGSLVRKGGSMLVGGPAIFSGNSGKHIPDAARLNPDLKHPTKLVLEMFLRSKNPNLS